MNEPDWKQLELTANSPKSRVKEQERSCSRIMREQVEMSAAALYSTIPLLPELEQSLSSLSAGGELGMEGLRRVMLSSEALMDDSVCLPPLHESSVDCETGQ
ncbi:uncharacterized protein [Littorina saxatilis]|uniref:Uncharacterized protein n=1 Tax=Littorina saxatilis TaxID=31220 RepID=A0AAN9AND4_9CAEN